MNEYDEAFNFIEGLKTKQEVDSTISYSGSEAEAVYQKMVKEWGGGLTTTFDELDTFFKFYPGSMYLFSGTSHSGKTTIALNIGARLSTLGKNVVLFSLEMGLSVVPKIKEIIGGDIPESFTLICSDEMLTPKMLVNKVQGLKTKPDLIIVDHLHFIEGSGKGLSETMSFVTHKMSMAAKKLKAPILCISHMRKINEDKEPTMDDLKDSQALQGVPDAIVMIHRKRLPVDPMKQFSEYNSRIGNLVVVKNRFYLANDPNSRHTGRIKYTLDDEQITFDWSTIKRIEDAEEKGLKIQSSKSLEDINHAFD